MKQCHWLPRLLAVALLLATGAGCVAVFAGGDEVSGSETGRIGAGGSMSVTFDERAPFEMHVSHEEVTLLVEGRTVVLPHYRGKKGVEFHGFDYRDGEIALDLGRGNEAVLDGLHLQVNDREYELAEPGTYRIDPDGGFSFEPN